MKQNVSVKSSKNVAALPSWAGAGTVENPYQIASPQDLVALSEFVNTGNTTKGVAFILMNDLDMSAITNFVPIGGWDAAGEHVAYSNFFNGSFNGNRKVIKNLSIRKEITDKTITRIGLFGYLNGDSSSKAEVKSLRLENVTLTGYSYVGILAGEARYAIISNVQASGAVSANQVAGGLIGLTFEASISSSFAACSVEGSDYIGGFCGENGVNSVIIKCYSKGSIGGNDNVGGFCGINGGSIEQSYVQGGITISANDNVGGFCGYNTKGKIKSCYSSTIRILANWYAGGFCGYNDQGAVISSCYTFAQVHADDYAGGFCGKNGYPNSLIKNCYSAGSISTTTTSGKTNGGFLGVQVNGAKSKNCFRLSTITSHNSYGTSKKAEEMKKPSFVNLINDNQQPAEWLMDFEGAAAKNGGYPILLFQDSTVAVATSCEEGPSPRGSKSKPGKLIGTYTEHQSKVVKKGFMSCPSEGSSNKDWNVMVVEGSAFEKNISITRTYYDYKAFVENELGETYYGNIITVGTAY